MMLTGFFNAIYEMEGDDLFIAASPAGPAPAPPSPILPTCSSNGRPGVCCILLLFLSLRLSKFQVDIIDVPHTPHLQEVFARLRFQQRLVRTGRHDDIFM